MTSRLDIKHWQIKAKVYEDRVEEVYDVPDSARTIKRKPRIKVWRIEQPLDHGAYGEVRLERNIEDGKFRAVKRIPIRSTGPTSSQFEKELKALIEFSKSEFRVAALFVDFFGWFKHGSDVFLAMEYVTLGNLEKNIGSSGKVPESEARDITEQILLGLEIMHAKSFAHRDIKPQNVLVVSGSPKWVIKLADFGLSKRLTESTVYQTQGGTPPYMAPEILQYIDTDSPNGEYTNAVDLWAVGCIAYRIITGHVPFSTPKLIKYCTDKSQFPSDRLYGIGITRERACFKFIRELLAAYPTERPSASQALNHAWITPGSTAKKDADDFSRPNQGTSGMSEPSIAITNYNTGTHDGLKSYDQPLASSTKDISSPQLHSALVTNLSASSNPLTVRRKTLPSLTGSTLRTLKGHTRWVWSVAFSPDGTMLASASADESVCVWDVARGEVLHRLKSAPTGTVKAPSFFWAVAFAPDSTKVAAAGEDKTVSLWDIAGGLASRTFEGHTDSVRSVAFSPDDGKLMASASNDKTIIIWNLAIDRTVDIPGPQKDIPHLILKGHTGRLRSVAFSPSGELLVSGSEDETVRIWHVGTGAVLRTFEGYTDSPGSRHWFWSVAFLPGDNRTVAFASEDETIRICDIPRGDTIQTLKGHTESVRSIAFSPDGKLLASASEDESVRVWDLQTGSAQMLKGHTLWVTSVAFSPDGKLVASASGDETIRLWDVKSIRFAHK